MYDPTGVGRELRSRVAAVLGLASREASDVACMETVCTQFFFAPRLHTLVLDPDTTKSLS